MLKYVWNFSDEDTFSVNYNGTNNRLFETSCEAGCLYCQKDALLGNGDKVEFLVPQKTDVIHDFVNEGVMFESEKMETRV